MEGKNLSAGLAIQSFCFRGLDGTDSLIEALHQCNVSRVELCGLHIDPFDPGRDQIAARYKDGGIGIAGFGVHYFDNDAGKSVAVFEFARSLGLRTINADLSVGSVDCVAALCQEYDMRIALHNHGRKHRLGSVWALDELFSNTPPNIGLCLDTAWMLDSGEDPLEVAQQFRDRLYAIHVKDFAFDRAGRPEDVVIGTGSLNLDGMSAFLVDSGFDGILTLEYEGDIDNPVSATRQCVDALRSSLVGCTKEETSK